MDENFYLPASHMETKKVNEVQFEILSAKKTKEYGVCPVTKPFAILNGIRVHEGLSDLRMGSTDRDFPCRTCNMRHPECPGHFGYLELAEPMFNIGFFDVVLSVLRCVCKTCGRMLLNREKESENRKLKPLLALKGNNRLREICKISPKSGACFCCQNPQPKIGRFMNMYPGLRIRVENRGVWSAADAFRVLDKIPDTDAILLGFDPVRAHPRDLLITVLPIPPPAVRPSVSFGSGISENELTAKLLSIVRQNVRLAKEIEDNATSAEIERTRGLLQTDLATYFNNASTYYKPAKVSQTSKMTLKSIYERLKGKQGRLRGNLMGKRVNFSARTVITGDPNIDVDEVGVPFSIAMTLTFPERVTPLNRHRLTETVRRAQYPSANAIVNPAGHVRRLNGMKPHIRERLTLEVGDIVERHVINGDVVLFNRQPTLHRMSMMGHRVRVLNFNTFRLNLTCTPAYNADFDGDEMNLHVPQSLLTKAEMVEMMMVPKNFVSPNRSSPCMGIVQDSLLGSYRLTDKEIFLDKFFVQNLYMWLTDLIDTLADLPIPAILKPRPLWTGKQIFSLVLPDVTHEKPSRFSHEDKGVVIRRGQLIAGHADKKLIGNAAGSFIHIIFNDKGSDAVAKFINGVQRITTYFLYHFSFSVGIQDTLGDENTLNEVQDIIVKARKQVRAVGALANENRLARKAGMTLLQSFEQEVNTILNNARSTASEVVASGVHRRNSFRTMIDAGSKGSSLNIFQIVAAVGQQNVFGGRIPFYFRRRTLPHFMLDDYGDSSRGHVGRGYVIGLLPHEFFFHTMGGREGLIDTAVKTAETGYFQRKLIKAMEDLHIAYDGTVRNANQEVVQMMYGEDGLDGTRIESGEPFKLYFQSDQELRKNFRFEYDEDGSFSTDFGGTYMKPSVKNAIRNDPSNLLILEGEFRRLTEARDNLRQWVVMTSDYSLPLPVNMTRLIRTAQIMESATTIGRAATTSNLNPIDVIQKVEKLLLDLRQCHPTYGRGPNNTFLTAHSQERIENALKIFSVHVLNLLASKRVLKEYKLSDKSFEYVLKEVRLKYLQSVIQAGEMVGAMTGQSCGEPATQMTLNTFHNAGISSKNVTLGVPRLLELLSVSRNQRNSSMTIYLLPPWNKTRAPDSKGTEPCAEAATHRLEFATLESIVVAMQIIYDPDDENTVVESDREMLELERMVSDAARTAEEVEAARRRSPWLVRLLVSGSTSYQKKISLEDVRRAILDYGRQFNDARRARKPGGVPQDGSDPTDAIPECRYHVQTAVTDPKLDQPVRIRLTEDLLAETVPILKREIPLMLAAIPLRGIRGVNKVFTGDDVRFEPDAATNGIPERGTKHRRLETEGTALTRVFCDFIDDDGEPICDATRTASDNIPEIFRTLGVEAARQKLLLEMRNVYKGYSIGINYRHYATLVDTMCHRGYLMAVSRVGVNRSNVGPMMRASFEETVGVLMKAAAFGERDGVRGVSANLILGNQAKVGTGLFDVMVDIGLLSGATSQADAVAVTNEANVYHGPSSVRHDMSSIPLGDGATPLVHDPSVAHQGHNASTVLDSRLLGSGTSGGTGGLSSLGGAMAADVASVIFSPIDPAINPANPFAALGGGIKNGGSDADRMSDIWTTASSVAAPSSHGTLYGAFGGGVSSSDERPDGTGSGAASSADVSVTYSSFGLQSSAPYGSVYAPSLASTEDNPFGDLYATTRGGGARRHGGGAGTDSNRQHNTASLYSGGSGPGKQRDGQNEGDSRAPAHDVALLSAPTAFAGGVPQPYAGATSAVSGGASSAGRRSAVGGKMNSASNASNPSSRHTSQATSAAYAPSTPSTIYQSEHSEFSPEEVQED